jgi:hypothetical protein
MCPSFQELADTYNSHNRDWLEVTNDLAASQGTSTAALEWLTDRKNMPSLETIKYEPSKSELGVWEEVPDPNPDQTEDFRRTYLPTPLELEKLQRQNPKKQLLRTPLPLFALQHYTLQCYPELNSSLQENGYAAGHIISRFNTGMFSHLEKQGLNGKKVKEGHSGLIGRVLNHLHGSQGWLYNCDDRGMHFYLEPLLERWEVAQNGRYIRVNGRVVQLKARGDFPRWSQFYQIDVSRGTGAFFLRSGYANSGPEEWFSSALELVEYFNSLK